MVQIVQPEELPVTECGHDPAFDDLYTDFDLGLVPRTIRTRRHDTHTVVHRHFLIGGVQIGIVATGAAYSRARVVGHQQPRNSPEVLKGVYVRTDPGTQLLIASRFRLGVGTRSQHHHEQGGLPDLSRVRILYRDLRPAPVDKPLLAPLVLLAKNYILLPPPLPIQVAEPAVAIPLRVLFPVIFPSQLQGQMGMLLELFVEGWKIREGMLAGLFYRKRLTKHGFFNPLLVPALRQRPLHPRSGRLLQIVMDGTLADRTGSGDLPLPQPQFKS